MTQSVLDIAREWADHDPDPVTKDEVLRLIDANDTDELARAFAGPLSFGTAGLRAEVGAGESRLNRAVIMRTTHGLVSWLQSKLSDAGHADVQPVVVIGCDARHGSEQFQKDAAQVVAAAGGRALVLPAKNPTPLTAYSVKVLHADAGIMVTASHNPPADNGYKVYLGGRVAQGAGEGVQLVAPADSEIAAAIVAAPRADEIPLSDTGIQAIDTRDEYLARATKLVGENTDVTIALTAMHGVGAALGQQLLSNAGFTVSLVPEQAEPDPDFPTVAFPNPEELGALDLAKRHATSINADVIIAYDPDADRCAVATPDSDADGGWRQLTGDELGALLGNYIATQRAQDGHTGGAFANSIVSGRLLAAVAKHHGFAHEATLTGFKWIARTPDLVFGYEEAIGYCPDPEAVADKDGIATSLVAASLVGVLKAEGRTLDDALDDLARTHGLFRTAPLTFRVDDVAKIAQGMDTLRKNPPTVLAGSDVVTVHDLADDPFGIGPTDGMYFLTDANDRIICRPSGTEPKLKCYLEVVLPVVAGKEIPKAKADSRLAQLRADLTECLGF